MAQLIPPQEPPKLLTADEILPTMRRIVDEKRALRDEIVRSQNPTTASFANTILPIIEVENRTSGEFTMIVLISFASPLPESRAAARDALKLASEASASSLSRRDLFTLVDAVKNNGEALDEESRRYVDMLWSKYKRSGHGVLEDEQIQIFAKSQNEIVHLRRQYIHNTMANNEGCWLAREDLDGLPEKWQHRYIAETPAEDSNRVFIPFKRAESEAFLKYCRNAAKRKQFSVARSRCLAENVSVFKEVIMKRHENAVMLGYPNHAAFKLEDRIAKSVEWVESFLSRLEAEFLPQGRKDMDTLIAAKQQHMKDSSYIDYYPNSMPPWDYPYYSRLAKGVDTFDFEKLSEYFPLCSVVSGLLDTVASCLGLRFDRMTAEQLDKSAWHDDVMGWAVWDTSPRLDPGPLEFVGYLYMDLLSREHKYKGSQDANLQSSFVNTNGDRLFPATVIMCSFPRPALDEVTLLTHDNIVSLFHECGHAMHDLLSRTRYSTFHGWTSPPDFSEISSLLFENWCWMPTILRKMSRQYTSLDPKYLRQWQQNHAGLPPPPDKLPETEIQRLISSRNHQTVRWYLSQMFYSRFDMALHSCNSLQECINIDPAKLFYELQGKLRLLPIVDRADWGHPEANFTHLMKGYDAGLYSYLSAHVAATNIFSKIFIDDPSSQEAWNGYRSGLRLNRFGIKYVGQRYLPDAGKCVPSNLPHPFRRLSTTKLRIPLAPSLISVSAQPVGVTTPFYCALSHTAVQPTIESDGTPAPPPGPVIQPTRINNRDYPLSQTLSAFGDLDGFQFSTATMDVLSSDEKPPVFNYVLSFLLVGIAWGGTTPFIRIAAKSHKPPQHKILDDPAVKASWIRSKLYGAFFSVVDLLRNPRYAVPLLLNLTGSVWFFLLIGQAGKYLTFPNSRPKCLAWASMSRKYNVLALCLETGMEEGCSHPTPNSTLTRC
ncbi:hypothetical protein NLG97_g4612 [Lecanicillium saksenae]|uniref:Uncharacterized protein n=1 Tax=Lecanicillium saksenae TaxID=468837 RepID=A0ACC1QY35_9HYPO|nr:hypothetical protein NLG97_g4612 [Lecanicillium saksenae]